MKFGISVFLLFLAFLFKSTCVLAQDNVLIYYKVILKNQNEGTLNSLLMEGVALDHSVINDAGDIEVAVNEYELGILDKHNIDYSIKIKDLAKHNEARLSQDDSWKNNLQGGACDLENYSSGSMGGYHVADEVLANLDKMREKFPKMISAKESIGKTIEGEDIYMVKISDNPDKDEEEPVAYYDALTHAREPMGMESLIYYMWWLLENYESDPGVKYLVDNRELYFVPLVNADGYRYNQKNSPNGGGMQRKNRRDNNCGGVDINRNFDADWGLAAGNEPCSESYKGPNAASEPETKAIQAFLDKIKPLAGFSNHAHGHMMISPKGQGIIIPQHDLFTEFAMEQTPEKFIGHGTPIAMVGYEATGTTLDYLYLKTQTIAWTPEIGKSGTFWPKQSEICPLNKEMLQAFHFASWIAGDFAGFHGYSFKNTDELIPNATAELIIRVKNKGLSTTSKDVKVEISSDDSFVEILKGSVSYGDVEKRAFASNESEPFEVFINKDAVPGAAAKLKVKVYQNGAVSYEKDLLLSVGRPEVFFYDNAESGKANWTGNQWDVTGNHNFGGENCFTDSKTKNYTAGSSSFTMVKGVDISNASKPFLEFAAKWSLQGNNDYVKVEVNSGGSWTTLKGIHTQPVSGGQGYTTHGHWVQEKIDLTPHKGSDVKVRFSFTASQKVHSDGFYFDEFRIVNYKDDVASGINDNKWALNLSLFPNPNNGKFQALIPGKHSALNLSVTNVYGQKVYEQDLKELSGKNLITIDLANNPKGIYFVHFTNGKLKATKKVVLE